MADAAAVPADASDAEQIELEDSLLAYCESHADTTPADLLRAFNVRCYLWPRLTAAERDACPRDPRPFARLARAQAQPLQPFSV